MKRQKYIVAPITPRTFFKLLQLLGILESNFTTSIGNLCEL